MTQIEVLSPKRRLNGWQRIGIVFSIAWFLGGTIWTRVVAVNYASEAAFSAAQLCRSAADTQRAAGRDVPSQSCDGRYPTAFREQLSGSSMVALLVGIVPIPLGWFLVYGAIALARWIRDGFVVS